MIKYITLILLLFAAPCHAFWQVAGGGGAVAATKQLTETFEGTGYYDTGWVGTGSPDPDYTSSPLAGSQSLSVPYLSYVKSKALTYSGTLEFDFLVNPTLLNNSGDLSIVSLRNSSNIEIASVVIRSSDVIRIYHGTANSTGSTVSANTVYHIWVYYTKSSGAGDGVLVLYLTAYTGSETKPGSPFASVATGTSITEVDKLIFGNTNSDPGAAVIFDNIYVE